MNQRRTEIGTFLDEDLLPQVQQVLATLKDDERERLERELARAYEAEASLGLTRGASQKAKELEARLSDRQSGADREAEVFSDLYTFFSRYYNEGDFISLRRYKAGQSHLTVARLTEGLGVVAEALICITNDADRG
ncbi:MAG: hypothetical protein M3Q71_06700 [Chloroflexota bacterium]|nr:hypothetical protein [Chloroflexota bacterium]